MAVSPVLVILLVSCASSLLLLLAGLAVVPSDGHWIGHFPALRPRVDDWSGLAMAWILHADYEHLRNNIMAGSIATAAVAIAVSPSETWRPGTLLRKPWLHLTGAIRSWMAIAAAILVAGIAIWLMDKPVVSIGFSGVINAMFGAVFMASIVHFVDRLSASSATTVYASWRTHPVVVALASMPMSWWVASSIVWYASMVMLLVDGTAITGLRQADMHNGWVVGHDHHLITWCAGAVCGLFGSSWAHGFCQPDDKTPTAPVAADTKPMTAHRGRHVGRLSASVGDYTVYEPWERPSPAWKDMLGMVHTDGHAALLETAIPQAVVDDRWPSHLTDIMSNDVMAMACAWIIGQRDSSTALVTQAIANMPRDTSMHARRMMHAWAWLMAHVQDTDHWARAAAQCVIDRHLSCVDVIGRKRLNMDTHAMGAVALCLNQRRLRNGCLTWDLIPRHMVARVLDIIAIHYEPLAMRGWRMRYKGDIHQWLARCAAHGRVHGPWIDAMLLQQTPTAAVYDACVPQTPLVIVQAQGPCVDDGVTMAISWFRDTCPARRVHGWTALPHIAASAISPAMQEAIDAALASMENLKLCMPPQNMRISDEADPTGSIHDAYVPWVQWAIAGCMRSKHAASHWTSVMELVAKDARRSHQTWSDHGEFMRYVMCIGLMRSGMDVGAATWLETHRGLMLMKPIVADDHQGWDTWATDMHVVLSVAAHAVLDARQDDADTMSPLEQDALCVAWMTNPSREAWARMSSSLRVHILKRLMHMTVSGAESVKPWLSLWTHVLPMDGIAITADPMCIKPAIVNTSDAMRLECAQAAIQVAMESPLTHAWMAVVAADG